MKSALEDLSNRRPVWSALSSLFLDNDVSLDRNWRVNLLASSPYSMQDIEQILIDEVYPICVHNLLLVAGEWAYFDEKWLESKILPRRIPSAGFTIGRFFARFVMSRSSEWQATKVEINVFRNHA